MSALPDQIVEAIQAVKDLFGTVDPIPQIPTDLTMEALWVMYCDTQRKRVVRPPKIETAVKRLLEDPNLDEVPIHMLAEIIREVYAAYGIVCKCSESSLRWYQSQRNLEWNIVRRKQFKLR
jgi:hypothetical protein